jgi:hypothetical protein
MTPLSVSPKMDAHLIRQEGERRSCSGQKFTAQIVLSADHRIGYKAWVEDINGNEIEETALKMAIKSFCD